MPVRWSPRLRAVVPALALAAGARALPAQAARGVPPRDPFASDSTAWQRVLAHVAGRLSTQLVRAAADTNRQPWTLRLPVDDPQRAVLDAQLRTLLRARAVTPHDAVHHELQLGPLRVEGDTARVDVRVNETRRCPGSDRTTGFGWSETVLVGRHPARKVWGAAFSRHAVVGDRSGCPAAPR